MDKEKKLKKMTMTKTLPKLLFEVIFYLSSLVSNYTCQKTQL